MIDYFNFNNFSTTHENHVLLIVKILKEEGGL
jgi:hypothetical protein